MNICIVPTMFPKYKGDYYGSFVYDEAKELVKRKFEIHVLTQHNTGIPYEEIMDGINVHRFRWLEPQKFRALVHFRGIKDYFRLFTYMTSLFFNLMRIIRKYDINIIHAHSTVPTGLVAILVAKLLGIPLFITVHGMDVNNYINHPLFKHLLSFTLGNCDNVIVVSNDLAEKVRNLGVDKKKIYILRNAVDTNRFKPIKSQMIRKKYDIDENFIILLFVGYLDTFKGVFELLEAFYEINKKCSDVILIIVGEGPKSAEIKEKIQKLSLDKFVILTGKISPLSIHEYYQSTDIFVLPSYTEGIPLSVLEAMACGLPIISSCVGGIPEVVNDGKNGFLVLPKNYRGLVEKLGILINNMDLRKEFSKKSVEIIYENSLNIEQKIDRLLKWYDAYR